MSDACDHLFTLLIAMVTPCILISAFAHLNDAQLLAPLAAVLELDHQDVPNFV
jgi:hypothetical protein